jgi:hypothetical protein
MPALRVMSNNEATARKYAELRRKMLVPRNEEMED